MEELKGFGGVASPLLAGFSLATVAALSVAENRPYLAGYAVAAFAGAAALHVFALQFAYIVVRYGASPDQRTAWHPEITVDEHELAKERRRHARDQKLLRMYVDRAGLTYNLGLLAFLLGLVLLLYPRDWDFAAGLGFVIAGSAFLFELWWVLSENGIKKPSGRPLMPRRKHVKNDPDAKPPPLDALARAAILTNPDARDDSQTP